MASKQTRETAKDPEPLRVEVGESGPVRREVRVEVPAARVQSAFDETYRHLAHQVQLPGFRPGRIPRSVLERRYAATVAEEVQAALLAKTLPEALEQEGIAAVSEPAIDAATPRPGADFRYTAQVEIKPEIALPDLAGLPARRPRAEVSEAEVEAELEGLRQRHAPLLEEPADTQAALGHVLQVDFVGRIDGRPFEGGRGRAVELAMGSGRFLPGFEEQLLGARSGDDRELRVRFPDDTGNPELRGREAVFQVHVAALKRRQLPALDDEFAKDLGDFDSLEALRSRVRADLESLRARAAREAFHHSLVDALIERTAFEVPPGLVERQRDQRLGAARRRLEGAVAPEALEGQLARWREAWRPDAEREVRESLLLEAVAAQEGLSASPADVEARIAELAREQGLDARQLREAFGDAAVEAAVRTRLVEQKALEFLGARAKVEETTDS